MKKMWLKAVGSAMLLGLGTLLAAGSVMADEPLEIEFFQQKGEEGPQKGYQQIVDKFNEENPDLHVTMNTVPDAPTVLVSRISAEDVPVIFTDFPTQKAFKQKVENGVVQPLTGQAFLENANASAVAMCTLDDGETYALPVSRGFFGVYYNIAMFEENGLKAPTTWEEFENVCETLKAAGITPIGLHGKDPGRAGHLFQSLLAAWNYDGYDLLVKACAGEAKIEGDEGFTKMLERFLELDSYANQDALALSDTECYTNFINGEYGMCPTGSYARGTLQALDPEFQLGCFGLPNDTAETTNVISGLDSCICVSAAATDEEKEAAYRFIDFVSKPENATLFYENDGAPSAIIGVGGDDVNIAPILELLNNGQTHDWTASSIDTNVQNELYNVFQEFWGTKDVETALKNMDETIEITAQQ